MYIYIAILESKIFLCPNQLQNTVKLSTSLILNVLWFYLCFYISVSEKTNFIPATKLHTWARCFVIDGPVIVPELGIILAHPEKRYGSKRTTYGSNSTKKYFIQILLGQLTSKKASSSW